MTEVRAQKASLERHDDLPFTEKLRAVDITPLEEAKISSVLIIDRFLNNVRAVAPKRKGAIETSIDEVYWTWKGKVDVVALEDPQMGIPHNWDAFVEYAADDYFDLVIGYEVSTEIGRQLTYAKTVLKPIVCQETLATIEKSTDNDAKKTAELKKLIAKIWIADSKMVSPASRLRTTLEGIRTCLADYIADEWIRKMVLTGGQIGSLLAFRQYLIRLKNLEENQEDFNRLGDLARQYKKIVNGSSQYMSRYLQLVQLAEEFRITPVPQESAYKYGAYDNEQKPPVGTVRGEPPTQEGAVGAKPNKTELISPGMKTMFMGIALSHMTPKTIRDIEHRFIHDKGSLHPLALAQHRYYFHELVQVEEKTAGVGAKQPQTAATRRISPDQLTAVELSDGIEKLHKVAMTRWEQGQFNKEQAPRYSEWVKRAQNGAPAGGGDTFTVPERNIPGQVKRKMISKLNIQDFCQDCLREGVIASFYGDCTNENHKCNMIRKANSRNRFKGKRRAVAAAKARSRSSSSNRSLPGFTPAWEAGFEVP